MAWIKIYSETDLNSYKKIEFESEQQCCPTCYADKNSSWQLGFFDFETACCCRHYDEYKKKERK